MPFSKESVDYFSQRSKQLETLKRRTKIGIFGSFSGSRKAGLLALIKFLQKNGYNARISEDLDTRPEHERKKKDPVCDRKLSEKLIRESDIHIFVLPLEHEGEPSNLAQSVSMEIERLHTLSECGKKTEKYVAVYAEAGLIGTMGSVCEGLVLSKKDDWTIEEYNEIQGIFKSARQFCMNCILDIYSY
jgi:hypothetical protein